MALEVGRTTEGGVTPRGFRKHPAVTVARSDSPAKMSHAENQSLTGLVRTWGGGGRSAINPSIILVYNNSLLSNLENKHIDSTKVATVKDTPPDASHDDPLPSVLVIDHHGRSSIPKC